jgi:hypothetical protein
MSPNISMRSGFCFCLRTSNNSDRSRILKKKLYTPRPFCWDYNNGSHQRVNFCDMHDTPVIQSKLWIIHQLEGSGYLVPHHWAASPDQWVWILTLSRLLPFHEQWIEIVHGPDDTNLETMHSFHALRLQSNWQTFPFNLRIVPAKLLIQIFTPIKLN